MPSRHLLLALAIVAIWGSNFVVIKLALGALPPLLFAALRFAFAVLPAIFFLPRPAVAWSNLAAYGLLIGVGQFGVLYLAMRAQISPGLASLVVQTQVFFTLLLA
ncbi:MAG TPA: EamA family transporter, partial [Roseateles sp.]|nr:EamA family transporter [Roseateles sp.]